MKYLLALLFLMSCSQSPKFKVGDCVILESYEEWERTTFEMILEIGKNKYKTSFAIINDPLISSPSDIQFYNEDLYTTIECPIEPHKFDKLQWKEPRPR